MDKIIFVDVKIPLDTSFDVSSTEFRTANDSRRRRVLCIIQIPHHNFSRKIRYFPYYTLKFINFCNFLLHPHPRVLIKSNSGLQFGLINIFLSYFCIF